MVKFSIIIPVRELNDYLLESVPIMLGLEHNDFEIIILPNEKPSGFPGYLDDERVRVIASGKVSPAVKRDLGAKHAKGDILAFIDDDAYPRKDWLKTAEKIFNKKPAGAVCGPAVTPPNSSLSEKASGLFFETYVGGGGLSFRYRPAKKSFYVDDYPTVNLLVRKKVFFQIGGFDNDFWPGEDTKFCHDLVMKGYKIWYSNRLIVWHYRRKLFLPHLRQIARYGKHRGYFAKKFPKTSLRLTYVIPSFFFMANVLLLTSGSLRALFFLHAAYFFIVIIDVFFRAPNITVGFLAVITVYLSHMVYGAMFIRGLFSRRFRSVLR